MTFPRYPKYKSTGVEWLGEVPEHWEVVPVRSIVAEQAAKNEGTVDSNYLSLMANVGVILYADKGDVGNKKPEDLSKCKHVSEGDFVINSMNYGIGSYGVSPYKGICSPVYIVLRPNLATVVPPFAFRIFENKAFQTYAQSFGNGILEHRCAINWDILKCIGVGVPSRSEQTAIHEFLLTETSKIDALVSEQEHLIALLKEKRQAVISHAVTKGLSPNVKMKPSGVEWLGDVPDHWEAKRIKFVVSMKSGGTPSKEVRAFWDGAVPWASAKDLKVDHLHDTQDHITQHAIDSGAAELVASGAVLIVVRGMILLHSFPVTTAVVPMAINQDLKAVVGRDGIHNEFVAWVLRGSTSESLRLSDEAGHGTKVIRMDAWAQMVVPVPPSDEQQSIAAFLDRVTAQLDVLSSEAERAIDLLKERRSALISAAVTGQIDVRGAVPA